MGSKWVESSPISFIITIIFCATPLFATENLLPDPGFDDSLMPAWAAISSTYFNWSWDTEDIDGSATSGSGRFENTWPSATGWYTVNINQCIENVDETALHDFGVMVLFPSGQAITATAEAYIQLGMYDDPGCTTHLDTELSAKVVNDQTDVWLPSSATDVPLAPGTESVLFHLSITKKLTADPAVFLYDDVYLRQTAFFRDGFETGDTTAWSN